MIKTQIKLNCAKNRLLTLCMSLGALLVLPSVTAHEAHEGTTHAAHQVTVATKAPSATYLGNEGLLISSGNNKVLFDPFFHNNYNHYQLVPKNIHQAMMKGEKPYDGISAIFISHAHGDHFYAPDMLQFLQTWPKAKMVAPKQAVDALAVLQGSKAVMSRVISVALDYGDKPWTMTLGDLLVEAVRIPHAGWPGRATVENMVFRVTLDHQVTVMHMGDADPDDGHFKPFESHWKKQQTDTAFPPYWFFSSAEGNKILEQRINAIQHIGVHVPVNVPKPLKASGKDYFNVPGEQRIIGVINH